MSIALTFFKEVVTWSESAFRYFKSELFEVQQCCGQSQQQQELSTINSEDA
jgi:hypothetical protein